MALDTAKRLPSAISDMALNRESSAWFSLDADVLEPIVSEMVGVIKAPSLDKTTFDCISILLRKEIQNLIDSKRDAAKERLKGGIENGRLTRSRFTRSDSPHTLTPGSSADSEPTFVGDIPSKIERSSRNTVWEELYDGCDGCADWGCAECAPQGSRSPVGSVMELAEGHASSVFVRQSPVSKRKNDSSSPRCFSQRPCSPETLPRHPRQYASSQTPCRRRRNSRVYVESEPSIVRRVQTMSLNDDSELESDIQVPEPKIYTATTTFPKSTQYPVPAVHIVDMKIEDVRNGDHYARRGKVTWSNGSIEAIWMDDLSKQYPQQLIQYYEKAL
jgi:hypothetical protein